MRRAELLIDLSQFVHRPARSGIQRVLVELIGGWPPEIVSADVGYRDSEDYTIVSLERARSVLQGYFDGDAENAKAEHAVGTLKTRLDQHAMVKIPPNQLGEYFSSYLLPEPTFRNEVLDTLRHWSRYQPQRTFAIFYDALPQTNPQDFPAPHQMGTSRYFREIANIENVACISRASLDRLVGRLRRRPASNAVVVPLGTNPIALPGTAFPPAIPTFVSIGTIEPRKNHPVILAAFDELWRSGSNYRLHFIGARGWQSDKFIKELLEKSAEDPDRFQWSEQAGDAEVRSVLAHSTGAIYLSEAEGYGLPAVEALAAGCPLIAAASLPALDGLPPFGQARLNKVTVESVKIAVQELANPNINNRLRSEISQLRFPTWQDFAYRFVTWIRHTSDEGNSLTMGQESEPTAIALS